MEYIGVCKFCGQTAAYTHCEDMTEYEINEQATRFCKCQQAAAQRAIDEKIEKAELNIDLLFAEASEEYGFYPLRNDKSITLLKSLAAMIANRELYSITLQIGRTKAKLSGGSNSAIKVERSETTKYKLEE